MSANYREPQFLLPNCKNLKLPGTGTSVGSGLTEDRHSLYSMDFDGNNDYIDTGYAFTSLTSFSISAWFKSDDTSTAAQAIVSSRINSIGTSQGLDLNISSDILYARVFNNGATEVTTAFTDTASWHHVAMIYNGTTLEMYLDGVSKGTATGVYTNSAANWLIGKWNAGANYFNGKIDETAIFSRALSTSEITTLYNNGAPSNPMLLSGKPIAYYPLGEQARKPGTAEWRFPNEVLQGQAINFDGNNDFISVNTNTLNITTAICISSWIKTSSTSGAKTIFCQSDRGSRGNFYLGQKHNYVQFGIYHPSGTTFINTQAYGIVSDNKWHNIVGTWDGTTNANAMKIYIDGNVAAQGTPSYTGIKNTTDRANFPRIGATYDDQEFFDGELSNIVVWNTDQSANIANIYNYGAPQTSYTVTPTAWYKLDKTSTFTGLNPNWHSALNFNGTSNRIDLSSSVDLGTKNTISAWVRNKVSQDRVLLGEDSYGSDFNIFGGYTYFLIKVLNSYMSFATSTPIIPINSDWAHIVFVRDGDNMSFYINGSLIGSSSTWTGGSPGSATTKFDTIGGKTNGAGASNWLGEISNLAAWSQVISAEDVKYLYNGGTPQTNISFEPTSWYKLDNLTTGIQDSGSASNNGTNNGATVVSSSVAVDEWVFENTVVSQTPNWTSSLIFNQNTTGNRVQIPHSTSLDITSNLSVSFWYKQNGAISDASAVSKDAFGSARSWFLWVNQFGGGNLPVVGVFDSSNNDYSTVGTIRVDDGNWHNIVMTYEPSVAVRLYIDGKLNNSNTTNIPSSIASEPTVPIVIGESHTSTFYPIRGFVNNVAIFNTTLDSTAITALYNNGQPEATISSSPVSWWKLDNTTTGIQDSIGSNNGTIVGTVPEIQTNVWTTRLNGESDTLPSTALVSSDLQFNSAYSSFSLDFDAGSSNFVEINNPGNIIGYGESAFTFSGWINADSFSDQDGIFCRRQDTNNRVAIKLSLTSSYNGIMLQAANASVSGYSSWDNIFNASRWYHICAIYDGTQSVNADRFKLFVDGVDQGARTSAGGTIPATLPNMTSTTPIDIGVDKQVGAPTRCFDGKIDEVSVFNKVLNQAEITSIYNNGYPKDITALAPVSWHRLGEDAYFNGNDFIIPNQITGAANGTSNGMPATALVADAPGSYAAGLGSSLALADRVGDAPLSTANSLSFNMTPENRISYPANYTPAQVDNVYSMDFDGANDYIQSSAIIPINSVSLWFKPDATVTTSAGSGVLISFGTTDFRNAVYLGSNFSAISNELITITNQSLNYSYYAQASGTIDTSWHHLAIVHDGSKYQIYLDGLAKTTTGSTPLITSQQIIIGMRSDSSSYFNGKIDEVAIFDYALTPRQIKEDIYNATTSGKTADLNNNSNLTPPVAWYRMGD